MRFPAICLIVLASLCPALAGAQVTLNKCIDAQGLVTYTNKPCVNAREIRKVEIDPAPTPDRPQIEAAPAAAANAETGQPTSPAAPVSTRPEKSRVQKSASRPKTQSQARLPSPKTCDGLSNKLGRTMDKMDQAHRKGYTQDQMDKWNEEVRDLERKKQQAGCF